MLTNFKFFAFAYLSDWWQYDEHFVSGLRRHGSSRREHLVKAATYYQVIRSFSEVWDTFASIFPRQSPSSLIFSSIQTTGARSHTGFSYSPSSSSMRAMYSSSNSATHHIFFPPRLQIVAFQQDPDGLSSYSWYQLAFDHFFRQQAHRPARPS